VLVAISLRLRKENLALVAGPFFSPYLAPYSGLSAITGLIPDPLATIAACLALWAAWLISDHILYGFPSDCSRISADGSCVSGARPRVFPVFQDCGVSMRDV
jgi:hypothetical protein